MEYRRVEILMKTYFSIRSSIFLLISLDVSPLSYNLWMVSCKNSILFVNLTSLLGVGAIKHVNNKYWVSLNLLLYLSLCKGVGRIVRMTWLLSSLGPASFYHQVNFASVDGLLSCQSVSCPPVPCACPETIGHVNEAFCMFSFNFLCPSFHFL